MIGQVEVRIRVDGRVKGHTREEMTGWIQDAAQQIVDSAKISAPYDTGKLVNLIQVAGVTSQSGVVIAAADYSAAQEFGTSRGIMGKHYMENAMNSTRSRFAGKLTFEIWGQ